MIGLIRKNQKYGFTLFEAVISIALLLMVIAAFGGFVSELTNTRLKSRAFAEVDGNMRRALSVIEEKIHSAQNIQSGASVWDTDPGTLVLSMTDPAKNPTIFNLNADNGTLFIAEGASSPVALTSSSIRASQLVFHNYSPSQGLAAVGITLSLGYGQNTDSYASYTDTVQTTITLRK